MTKHIVLIDNQDSFVYNLVDAFALPDVRCTVFRNTVPVSTILAAEPDLIVLSPGPGHPREAGSMMELINVCLSSTGASDAKAEGIPLLGICLGFQALLEHFGGSVGPCGPVHGVSDAMTLTAAGLESPLFTGLTDNGRVPVARYHSLGCVDTPPELEVLGTSTSEIGDVAMAAYSEEHRVLGLQFHPESVLSPSGPHILNRAIDLLLAK